MILDNETVLEQGNYRVKVEWDYDPLLPEGDVYPPQFMVPITSNQRDDLLVNMEEYKAKHIERAYLEFDDEAMFKRWAKLFHNVNANIISTSGYAQGEQALIIVWPDEHWLDTVGQDNGYMPGCGDVADLASYIWGDVIALELQVYTEWFNHKGEVMATFETVDSIGGTYVNQGQGDAFVRYLAQELLESNIS